MKQQKVIPILVGPTASGKTSVLERIHSELQGTSTPLTGQTPSIEVVSADAYQVYRGLSIGTAKPDRALLEKLRHHLIDICDPREGFSVSDFVARAELACTEILERGAYPIISGGTAYYIKHLVYGPPQTPHADPSIRKRLADQVTSEGLLAMHARLARIDPKSAAKIHPNDTYRITRALEVFEQTGRPLSDFARTPGPTPRVGEQTPVYQVHLLLPPREVLVTRIRLRVETMFANGLRQEVDNLVQQGLSPHVSSMGAIGYREFFVEPIGSTADTSQVAWPLRQASDGELIEDIVLHSVQYAKRQATFMRSLDPIAIYSNEAEAVAGLLTALS